MAQQFSAVRRALDSTYVRMTVCLLEQGKYNRIVGMKGEKLVDYPVDEALEMTKTLDPVLIDVCNTISI